MLPSQTRRQPLGFVGFSDLRRLASRYPDDAQQGVSPGTISRLERGEDLKPATVAAIRAALEAARVEFIPENGGGAAVRLREATWVFEDSSGKRWNVAPYSIHAESALEDFLEDREADDLDALDGVRIVFSTICTGNDGAEGEEAEDVAPTDADIEALPQKTYTDLPNSSSRTILAF